MLEQLLIGIFFSPYLFEGEQILFSHSSAPFMQRKLGKVEMWDSFVSSS